MKRKTPAKKWEFFSALEYYALRDRNTNRAIFYTNLMERGHCYVFAFTLKSMYHVNTMTGETAEAWEFPYDITTYVSTEVYNNQIQRSAGTEVYKETPRVAAYLDHTTISGVNGKGENSAVWKYLVYDPDGAMEPAKELEAGMIKDKVYAGRRTAIVEQVSQDRLSAGFTAGVLSCTKAAEVQVSESEYNSSWKDVFRTSFGLNTFPKRGTVRQFEVTVKDGASGSTLMKNFSETPYEVWFAVQEFDDQYTGMEDGSAPEYRSTRRNNNLLINDAEHFAVSTVQHRYDAFTADMEKLKVTVTLSGADNVLIDVDKDSTAVNQIVGFYYELRNILDSKVKQWGFIQYTDNMLIPLQEPETGTSVELYLQVVYDTGIAGLNKAEIPSSIHIPRAETPGGAPALSTEFYGIQKQESNLYATGENINTRQFIYSNATAGNSLYRVRDRSLSSSEQGTSPHMYEARKWNGNYTVPQKYIYGRRGAYLDTSGEELPDMPLLKGLAESDTALEVAAGQTGIEKKDGKVIITVPAVVPNISAKSVYNNGFHSVDISVTLTKKSVEALLLTVGQRYKPEIYLELYEKGKGGASDTQLNNTGNRYFALVSEEDQDKGYVNKAKTGAETSGWRVDGSSDVAAYFDTRPASTDADRNYRIAVRNLQMGTSYVFKMYCYDTSGNKVYIIDNDTSAGRPSGAPVALEFTMSEHLNVGGSISAGSQPLSAEYQHQNYGQRNLKVEYSLNKTGDIYLQYQIKAENGNEVSNAGPDAMMKRLGYLRAADNKEFWHYDTGSHQWKSITYPVYSREDRTVYSPSTRQSETYQLDVLPQILEVAGNYKLEITAYDLYTGNPIHCYQDGTELKGGAVPTVNFTVPVRSSIMVEPKVTYESDKNEDPTAKPTYKARLTLTVRDNGLRLGVKKADGTLDMGYYRVVLEKAGSTAGSWQVVNLNSGNPDIAQVAGARKDDLFMRGITYTITYPVQEGERYRLRVQGVDTLDLNESMRDKEQDLYDSETDSRMKVELSVSALDKPQLGNPAFDFNIHTGDFTISVQRGSNLDQIKQAVITLYNMSGSQGQVSAYETVNCSFGAQDNKGWQDMVIPLSNILDDWKKNGNVEEKDSLVLTVQYMGDGKLLGESTFSFMYK